MKKRNYSAIILYIVTMLFWFSTYAYVPYITPTLKLMGASAAFVGFVGGAYGFMQLVLRIPLGIISDKTGKQKIFIIICTLCCTLSALGMYALQTPFGFLISRLMAGVASSAWVSFTVLYSSYFERDKASSAITILSSANYGGRLLSFIVIGVVVSAFGANSSFIVAFIVGFAGFLMSFFIKDINITREPLKLTELFTVVKNKTLIITTILAILEQIICFATFQTFTSDILKMAGASNSQLSMLNAMLTLPVVIVSLLAGKYLIKKLGSSTVICAGFLLKAVYCVALPFVKDIALLYVMQFIGGMGTGLAFPVLNGLCISDIEPEKKTTAMGFYQAMYSIGMTLGPVIMGFFVTGIGYDKAFILIGIISLVTAAATPLLLSKRIKA